MQEIWKDVIVSINGKKYDYTGFYQVNNFRQNKIFEKNDFTKKRKVV